jgi:C4-dicarboxylate transporter DctM subunit
VLLNSAAVAEDLSGDVAMAGKPFRPRSVTSRAGVSFFVPVVKLVGLDPVLVGIVITLQVAIGSATPPLGCDIFTAIAVFKRPYLDVVRGTPPFVLMLMLSAVVLIFFPQIALFLRDLAFN